ncbi:MAG: hypothetical protein ACYC0V_16860 [Armatimonadota bacterium]
MVKNKDARIDHDAEQGILNTMRYYYFSKDLDASYVQIVSPLLNKHPDAITHVGAGLCVKTSIFLDPASRTRQSDIRSIKIAVIFRGCTSIVACLHISETGL